jgi:hypothetical protein
MRGAHEFVHPVWPKYSQWIMWIWTSSRYSVVLPQVICASASFLSGVLFLSDNYHLPFLIINAIQPCPPCKHFPPEMCCQTIFLTWTSPNPSISELSLCGRNINLWSSYILSWSTQANFELKYPVAGIWKAASIARKCMTTLPHHQGYEVIAFWQHWNSPLPSRQFRVQ